MRTLARAATSSLVALCAALVLMVAAVAAIGIASTRSAADLGTTIAYGELDTAVVTGQLARNIDAAYAAGQAILQSTQPAQRAQLRASLDNSLLPAIDQQLYSLEQLHIGDPPAEWADLQLFFRRWAAARDLLSSAGLTARPAPR